MLGQIPCGGIYNTGQSTGQALTTATDKLLFTNAVNLAYTGDRTGDPAVKPDATNSRVQLNSPGIYEVSFDVTGGADGAENATFQLRKTVNGTQTAVAGAKTASLFSTTNKFSAGFTAFVEVLASDLPTSGGAATFADPSQSSGAYKPGGGFAGAGAAPLTGVYLDVAVTGDASQTITLTDMRLLVKRLG
jgi:hypothetical protein